MQLADYMHARNGGGSCKLLVAAARRSDTSLALLCSNPEALYYRPAFMTLNHRGTVKRLA
jgi:hypothetical protein